MASDRAVDDIGAGADGLRPDGLGTPPPPRHLDRWVWLVIIVIFSILGPLAYFFLGREEG